MHLHGSNANDTKAYIVGSLSTILATLESQLPSPETVTSNSLTTFQRYFYYTCN